ncbi:MAG: hypothetical protein GWP03_00090 [Proteobacteria bacterium]|nr:hypothetical protein [Pseudomonadota bacterium]
MKKRLKVGLVLGSGGARGLSHIGVLQILKRKNIKLDFITGTSIGAVIGSLYASGMEPEEIEAEALKIDKKQARTLFSPSLTISGLTDGKNIINLLKKYLGDKKFENLKIPFACVATEFYEGKAITLNSGYVLDAVRASLSVPILIKPYVLNDTIFLDGGISNPVPVDVAREMGADVTIAVNVINNPKRNKRLGDYVEEESNRGTEEEKSRETKIREMIENRLKKVKDTIPNIIENKLKSETPPINVIATKLFELAESQIVEQKLLIDKPEVLIEPYTYYASIMDFELAPRLIYQGKRATLFKLDDINTILRGEDVR